MWWGVFKKGGKRVVVAVEVVVVGVVVVVVVGVVVAVVGVVVRWSGGSRIRKKDVE